MADPFGTESLFKRDFYHAPINYILYSRDMPRPTTCKAVKKIDKNKFIILSGSDHTEKQITDPVYENTYFTIDLPEDLVLDAVSLPNEEARRQIMVKHRKDNPEKRDDRGDGRPELVLPPGTSGGRKTKRNKIKKRKSRKNRRKSNRRLH